MKKTHSGILGLSSDSDALPSENEDSGGEESEGGGIMGDDLFREDLENLDDTTSAVPVPSPLRRSPRRVNQSSSDASGDVNVQPPPAARSGATPSSISAITEERTPPSVNDGVTHSAMAKASSDDVIQSAMAKASSRLIASKTKNSSNKNSGCYCKID